MQNPEQIHIVIFTGGSAPEYEKTRLYWKTHPQADYVIAADSGLETCASYAFSPCVIMGDFDSIQDRALLDYYNDDIKVPFDSDKDFTDTELAVSKAYEIAEKLRKTPFITLVGGDGGRIDHLLKGMSMHGSAKRSAFTTWRKIMRRKSTGLKKTITFLLPGLLLPIAEDGLSPPVLNGNQCFSDPGECRA